MKSNIPTRSELAQKLDEGISPKPLKENDQVASAVLNSIRGILANEGSWRTTAEDDGAELDITVESDGVVNVTEPDEEDGTQYQFIIQIADPSGGQQKGGQQTAKKVPKYKIVPMKDNLADVLANMGASAETAGGKVTEIYDGEDNELSAEQLAALGIDPDNIGTVEEHDEGSDRGGYVPVVVSGNQTATYDEMGGEWY